jgi:hypothetical protein
MHPDFLTRFRAELRSRGIRARQAGCRVAWKGGRAWIDGCNVYVNRRADRHGPWRQVCLPLDLAAAVRHATEP